MTKQEIQAAIASGECGKVVDVLSYDIQDKWESSEMNDLTCSQIVVIAVSSFIGQVCSGGIMHYVGTSYSDFLPKLKGSFRVLGVAAYDNLIDCIVGSFNGDVPENQDKRWKKSIDIRERCGETFWEELDNQFFSVFRSDEGNLREIDKRIAQYAFDHYDSIALK